MPSARSGPGPGSRIKHLITPYNALLDDPMHLTTRHKVLSSCLVDGWHTQNRRAAAPQRRARVGTDESAFCQERTRPREPHKASDHALHRATG